jgi:hypothetical protein
MDHSRLGRTLEAQIGAFSGNVSHGLCKVGRRFVREMVYGLSASGSVKLSDVGRRLNEPISLHKTITRLSNNLNRKGLWEHVSRGVLSEAAGYVDEDTLLVLDPSDISKPYARKMEHQCRIMDGSKKEKANGYWTCNVIGVESGESVVVPLYQRLYSHTAPDFVSENEEIDRAVEMVSSYTGGRGVWVIDRGGDRRKLFDPLLDRQAQFLIRMRGDRHMIFGGRKRLVMDIVNGCPLPYAEYVVRQEDGKERTYAVEFGFRRVRLPGRPEQLYLVVVKGFGEKPLMLLTTRPMRRKRSVLWWAVEAYLTRWRIEETIRFVKQSYDLEDVRVLRYRRLQNLMALVLAVAFFACARLGRQAKLAVLAHHALKAARRIFGIPDFKYYALADGLKTVLSRRTAPLRIHDPPSTADQQLSLFEW